MTDCVNYFLYIRREREREREREGGGEGANMHIKTIHQTKTAVNQLLTNNNSPTPPHPKRTPQQSQTKPTN